MLGEELCKETCLAGAFQHPAEGAELGLDWLDCRSCWGKPLDGQGRMPGAAGLGTL